MSDEAEQLLDLAPAVKRARPKPVKGPGVATVGNRYVGSFSGKVVEKAIFIPGVKGAAFANIPCAVAWLTDCAGIEIARIAELTAALAEAYDQTTSNVTRSPHRSLLATFGGELDYDTWIGDLAMWDGFTDDKGETLADYKKRIAPKPKVAKKPAKKQVKVAFDAGMYLITVKGQPQRIDPEPVEGVVPSKHPTAVSALRRMKQWSDLPIRIHDTKEHHMITGARDLADPKQLNVISSKIAGADCYGPALVIFLKKASIKL
jgi:hypothetical protein